MMDWRPRTIPAIMENNIKVLWVSQNLKMIVVLYVAFLVVGATIFVD